MRTQERGEGRLRKKVTRKDVGEGFTAKNCDATHLRVTCFLNYPMILPYFAVFLRVYLLIMLLAFFETNKSNISKKILIIYTKQDISRTTRSWFAKRIKG